MSIQIVVFKLGVEEYAIEISAIEGIIKMQTITKLPHAHDFVAGVTNLRGNIVPVIDLKRRLRLPQTEITIETRIIVALLYDTKIGMIVDAVSQVVEIPDSNIEPAPAITTSIDSTFIRGIVKIEDALVILLDLDSVFSSNEKGKRKTDE